MNTASEEYRRVFEHGPATKHADESYPYAANLALSVTSPLAAAQIPYMSGHCSLRLCDAFMKRRKALGRFLNTNRCD